VPQVALLLEQALPELAAGNRTAGASGGLLQDRGSALAKGVPKAGSSSPVWNIAARDV